MNVYKVRGGATPENAYGFGGLGVGDLSCGILQSSRLGALFISTFKRISRDLYVHHIQLYFFFKPHKLINLSILNECLNAVSCWMANTFLQ